MEERPGAEQALLEAVAFLVTAWKNLFAYPPGHPVRAAALDSAHVRLTAFMAAWGRLVLGVARDGLLYGEKKIESANVGAFAEALYRRNAALVYIEEDVAPRDLECLLRLLADAPGGPERAPIGEELRAAGVDRVTITSIDYTRFVMTDRLTVAEPRPTGSLWDSLIGALLTGEHLTPDGAAPLRGETYSAAGLADLLTRSGGLGGSGGPGGAGGAGGAEGEGGGSAVMRTLASTIADHLTRVRGGKRACPSTRSRSSSARSRRECASRCSPPHSGPSTPRSSHRSAWPAWWRRSSPTRCSSHSDASIPRGCGYRLTRSA
jgi:hypothetical protein